MTDTFGDVKHFVRIPVVPHFVNGIVDFLVVQTVFQSDSDAVKKTDDRAPWSIAFQKYSVACSWNCTVKQIDSRAWRLKFN